MRKILLWVTLLSLTALFEPSAYAILDLELTQGVDLAIPVAVIPFSGQQSVSTDTYDIIMNDLSHSGEIKPIAMKNLSPLPRTASDINFSSFQHIDYVVMGRVVESGVGRYRVECTLLDVNKGLRQDKSIVLKRSYVIRSADLRRVSHRIADDIYAQVVGVKGVFSTKIAYILEREKRHHQLEYALMIADADGYNPQPILISNQPLMSPSWSRDGQSIAYVSFEGVRASIYISDVATGKRRLVSRVPGINGAPAFSPDGSKMALVLSKSGNPDIYVMDLSSGHLTQLTRHWGIDTEPSWSTDGRSIIFTSDRGGRPQIYRVDITTQSVQRLTYNGGYNARASITPDGKQMVLLHRDARGYNIAVQDLQSGVLNVLSHSVDNQSPSMAPNGKMIVYTAQQRDKDILEIVSVDGRVKLRLPEKNGSVREPAWSPFLN